MSLMVSGAPGGAAVLRADATWQGEVVVHEDVLVPAGVTLTVAPGTRVIMEPNPSTRTDPEYLSPLTEITVRGKLAVLGQPGKAVVFALPAGAAPWSWAGIWVHRGSARLEHCTVQGAETGIQVEDGTLALADVTLSGNRYGLVVDGAGAQVSTERTRIFGNDHGAVLLRGARFALAGATVRDNRRGNIRELAGTVTPPPAPPVPHVPDGPLALTVADGALQGDVTWSGRVLLRGVVRVPEGSRLIILPGTLVEVTRRDNDGDGFGDNGVLLQGVLIAKGTPGQPITFRSAEAVPRPGDWNGINIMDSDGAANLVEYCHVQHAYHGLHFHFSNVIVQGAWFTQNLRGMQFQESRAEVRGTTFTGNGSAVHARDSEVWLEQNVVAVNETGLGFFRAALHARGNVVAANARDGLRVREGSTWLTGNYVDGNRHGIQLSDAYHGVIQGNLVTNNLETGLAVRAAEGLVVEGNFVSGNGVHGISVQDARLELTGNVITHNGESGLAALGLDGVVRGNNLAANLRWAIDLRSPGGLEAPGNWWGEAGPAAAVLDDNDEPGRGHVHVRTPAAGPPLFRVPALPLFSSMTWDGVVHVEENAAVLSGATLTLAPGTVVRLAPGVDLVVHGRLLAEGTAAAPVIFTSIAPPDAGAWGELRLEHADGSRVVHGVFEHATWGLHAHFTDLQIHNSVFRHNQGGMRFRSGPVRITGSRFEHNGVGIRAHQGQAVILGNRVGGNDVGLFVREKGSGLAIHDNDLSGNRGYAVRLGDFNDEDVDASGNFWGPDPGACVYDARQEPGVGTVRMEPIRTRAPPGAPR